MPNPSSRRAPRGFVALVLVLISLWLAMPAFSQTSGLGDFLDEEGALVIPEGFVGSLDPAGFSMTTAADGPPRFMHHQERDLDEEGWTGFGGVSYGCYGVVHAVAVAESGLVYLGGEFRVCEDKVVNHIAAYDPDTELFHALGEGVRNGTWGAAVQAIAVVGSEVFVGGRFTKAGGRPANNLARWDGSQWHSLGSETDNGTSGEVRSLAHSGSDLYIGGSFTQAGGQQANRVVRWDGQHWHSLGKGGQNGLNGMIYSVVLSGSDLYVGGGFTQAGGQLANRVARWDGEQWHSLGSGAQNGTSAQVFALAASGSDVYAGGFFREAGGETVRYMAHWDGEQWRPMGAPLSGSGHPQVWSLAVLGNDVYMGGDGFETEGSATDLMRWDGEQWHRVGDLGWRSVAALAASGGDLYVGGAFNRREETIVNNFARWDGAEWHRLGNGGQNGVDSLVTAVAVFDGDIYVGGWFTSVGGQSANHIARWDGVQWHSLGSGNQNGVNTAVDAIAVLDDGVYVGGFFDRAGGIWVNQLARWDGSHWHGVGTGLDAFSRVFTLSVLDDDLFVGGQFLWIGGQRANNVARWDGSQWHGFGAEGQVGTNGSVRALAVTDSNLYVGGDFTQAGGAAASRVARWDGTGWHAIDAGAGSEINGGVRSIAVLGDDVYIAGRFTEVGEVAVNHLARWDGDQWQSLGSGEHNGVNADFGSFLWGAGLIDLVVAGNNLYVGGGFDQAGGKPANNLARWDGSRWHGVGNWAQNGIEGISAGVLAESEGEVFAAGNFHLAGGQLSVNLARYSLPLQLSVLPATIVAGEVGTISVGGGRGSGEFDVQLTQDENACALDGLTLTALAEGECLVTVTKASDGDIPEQSREQLVRVVSDPGAHLIVEIDMLSPDEVPDTAGSMIHGQCEQVGFRIQLSNNGPLAAEQVRVQMPAPAGFLPPVEWVCEVEGTCSAGNGQGAMDAIFSLPVNASAEVYLAGCLDTDAAYLDIEAYSSLLDGPMLLFPEDASGRLYLPLNNDGIFRSRFD